MTTVSPASAPASPPGEAGAGPRVLFVSSEGTLDVVGRLRESHLRIHETGADADLGEVARQVRPDIALLCSSLGEEALARLSAELDRACAAPRVLTAPEPTGDALALAIRTGADALYAPAWDPMMLQRIARRRPVASAPRAGADTPLLPGRLIGASEPMRDVWRLTMLAAESDASVAITGETGAGKEIVARALHRFSPRRAGPFVAINCAAVPEALLESELFGHERGAFTGAESRHRGTFERASGGTLLLDEVGEMPMSLQAKLLRVLQERAFQRVGGSETIAVDTRVLAATNRTLRDEVDHGRFRADLFYRLCSLSIRVPPLRERRADVLALWEQLLTEWAALDGRSRPETSPAVHRWLMRYEWPGNLRELENVVRHILTVATGDLIRPADLPEWVGASTSSLERRPPRSHGLAGMSMKEVERVAILETYEVFGTIRGTAEALEISPRKVQYRLKDYRESGHLPEGPGRAGDPPRRRLRLLLAEDDDELRGALTELLEEEGCDVVAVRDGTAFLEHIGVALLLDEDAAPVDAILADVRMPGVSGLQILRGVRARGWRVPVIVMSAFGDRETREEAESLGVSAFLDKPLDVAALHRVIRAATS